VNFRLTVNRFEGDKKQVAVLLAEDCTPVNFLKALLPKGIKVGDNLTLTIELKVEVPKRVAEETRAVQDELKRPTLAATSRFEPSRPSDHRLGLRLDRRPRLARVRSAPSTVATTEFLGVGQGDSS
jgi:hypothetical protein